MSRKLPVFNKPKYKEPCNNCGACCYMETCEISEIVFGDDRTPCVALEVEGDKFLCGLLRSPVKYLPNMKDDELRKMFTEAVSFGLGIGRGCFVSDEEILGDINDNNRKR
jgi:hypothetical protein